MTLILRYLIKNLLKKKNSGNCVNKFNSLVKIILEEFHSKTIFEKSSQNIFYCSKYLPPLSRTLTLQLPVSLFDFPPLGFFTPSQEGPRPPPCQHPPQGCHQGCRCSHRHGHPSRALSLVKSASTSLNSKVVSQYSSLPQPSLPSKSIFIKIGVFLAHRFGLILLKCDAMDPDQGSSKAWKVTHIHQIPFFL